MKATERIRDALEYYRDELNERRASRDEDKALVAAALRDLEAVERVLEAAEEWRGWHVEGISSAERNLVTAIDALKEPAHD